MKGFGIYVKNDLLDPKHIENMGVAVWLYMWCLDKMTSISEEGVGKILGGKPIKHEDVEKDLGVSLRTYRRWLSFLSKKGYINVIRTPYGLSISVNKAFKKFGRSINSISTDVPQLSHRYAKSGTSRDKSGTSNKTVQYDNTKTSQRYASKEAGDREGTKAHTRGMESLETLIKKRK